MYNQERFEKFTKARWRMVENDLKGRGITDSGVLKVMGELGREEFVSGTYESQAYADGPLPIGCGQTISQPYIVALMTQELRLDANCTVLEIGTGCGYQTAVLSRLVRRVYTVERFGQLSESAQAILGRLGVENVEFFVGDGSSGWPEKKIFDRIMVTAAVPAVPEPLLEQLATGGLIVAPVGGQSVQRLIVCEKKPVGVVEKAICEVRFVRLIGEYGFKE
ncbi:MAG: protein-L-isoaspartate(D-aspartate) O-methyltransferase [Planctomycetota bacterium]|jgi:protein-L-isoaspartate(D-aspartate) O-methyltransferase